MADVFISYSRRDSDFVAKLAAALKTAGRDAWVDVQGIRAAEDWKEKIFREIDRANTFLFVVSLDSLQSEIAKEEVSHAALNNKRMIPLFYRAVEDKSILPALGRFQGIDFSDDARFAAGVSELLNTLATDIGNDALTRLLTRAQEWEQKGKERSYLLRGADLADAEQMVTKSANREPKLTKLQSEYILASRQAATKTQRIVIGAVAVAAVLALALAGAALWQRKQARRARDEALQARVAETERDNARTQEAIAKQQRDVANVQRLSAQGRAVSQQERSLGALLAAESVAAATSINEKSSEAEEALRFVLSDIGGASLAEFGFKAGSGEIQISNDGTWVAIAGVDRTIYCLPVSLWRFQDRQQLVRIVLEGTQRDCNKSLLSPDGRCLLTFNDRNARSTIWRLSSKGPMVQPTDADITGNISSGQFSWDSKWLLVHQLVKKAPNVSVPSLKLFDVSGPEPREVSPPHLEELVKTYAMDPANMLVAIAGEERTTTPNETVLDRRVLNNERMPSFELSGSDRRLDQPQETQSISVVGLSGAIVEGTMPGQVMAPVQRLTFSRTARYLAAASKHVDRLYSDMNVAVETNTARSSNSALNIYRNTEDKEWSRTDCWSILIIQCRNLRKRSLQTITLTKRDLRYS